MITGEERLWHAHSLLGGRRKYFLDILHIRSHLGHAIQVINSRNNARVQGGNSIELSLNCRNPTWVGHDGLAAIYRLRECIIHLTVGGGKVGGEPWCRAL